jgi:hypothetical protein
MESSSTSLAFFIEHITKLNFSICHNPILGYSLKFTIFQNKNQKIKQKLVTWRKQAGESSCNFLEEIQDLIGPHYAQKWREKKCKFKVKLNDYWTNLHKN